MNVTPFRARGTPSFSPSSSSSSVAHRPLLVSKGINHADQVVQHATAQQEGYYFITVANLSSTQCVFVIDVDPLHPTNASTLIHDASSSHHTGVQVGELTIGSCVCGIEALKLVPTQFRYVASSDVCVLKIRAEDFRECTRGNNRRIGALLERQMLMHTELHREVVAGRSARNDATPDSASSPSRSSFSSSTPSPSADKAENKSHRGMIVDKGFSYKARAEGASFALLENRVRTDWDRVALPSSSSTCGIKQRVNLFRSQPHLSVALAFATQYLSSRSQHLAYFHSNKMHVNGKMQLYSRLFQALPHIYDMMRGGDPQSARLPFRAHPRSEQLQVSSSSTEDASPANQEGDFLPTEEDLGGEKKSDRPQTATARQLAQKGANVVEQQKFRPASAFVRHNKTPDAAALQVQYARYPQQSTKQSLGAFNADQRSPQRTCSEKSSVVDPMANICNKKSVLESVSPQHMTNLRLALQSPNWSLGQFGFAPSSGVHPWERTEATLPDRAPSAPSTPRSARRRVRPRPRPGTHGSRGKATIQSARGPVSRASRLVDRTRRGGGGSRQKHMDYNAMTDIEKLLQRHKQQNRNSIIDKAIKISPAAEMKLKQEHEIVRVRLSAQREKWSMDEKLCKSSRSLLEVKRTMVNSKPDRAVVQSMMLNRKRNIQVLRKHATLGSQRTRLVFRLLRRKHSTLGLPKFTPLPSKAMIAQFYEQQHAKRGQI
jgi:hypothetical protein